MRKGQRAGLPTPTRSSLPCPEAPPCPPRLQCPPPCPPHSRPAPRILPQSPLHTPAQLTPAPALPWARALYQLAMPGDEYCRLSCFRSPTLIISAALWVRVLGTATPALPQGGGHGGASQRRASPGAQGPSASARGYYRTHILQAVPPRAAAEPLPDLQPLCSESSSDGARPTRDPIP